MLAGAWPVCLQAALHSFVSPSSTKQVCTPMDKTDGRGRSQSRPPDFKPYLGSMRLCGSSSTRNTCLPSSSPMQRWDLAEWAALWLVGAPWAAPQAVLQVWCLPSTSNIVPWSGWTPLSSAWPQAPLQAAAPLSMLLQVMTHQSSPQKPMAACSRARGCPTAAATGRGASFQQKRATKGRPFACMRWDIASALLLVLQGDHTLSPHTLSPHTLSRASVQNMLGLLMPELEQRPCWSLLDGHAG